MPLATPLSGNPCVAGYMKGFCSFFDARPEREEPGMIILSASMDYYNFVNFTKAFGAAFGKRKGAVFNDAVSEFYEILREEVVGRAIRDFWQEAEDNGDFGPTAEFRNACRVYSITLHDLLKLTFHKCLEKAEYLGGRDAAKAFENAMRKAARASSITSTQTLDPGKWEMRFFYGSASNLFFAHPASGELFERILSPAMASFAALFSD